MELSHKLLRNSFTYERPSVVRYKLRLTNGRCSHCTSPNVSRHHSLHTLEGLHEFKLSTCEFFLFADLQPCEWLVSPFTL